MIIKYLGFFYAFPKFLKRSARRMGGLTQFYYYLLILAINTLEVAEITSNAAGTPEITFLHGLVFLPFFLCLHSCPLGKPFITKSH